MSGISSFVYFFKLGFKKNFIFRCCHVDDFCKTLKLPNRDKNAKILTWKIDEKDLKYKLRRHKNEALQKRTVV